MITKQLPFIKSPHILGKTSDILYISSLILPTTLGTAVPQMTGEEMGPMRGSHMAVGGDHTVVQVPNLEACVIG